MTHMYRKYQQMLEGLAVATQTRLYKHVHGGGPCRHTYIYIYIHYDIYTSYTYIYIYLYIHIVYIIPNIYIYIYICLRVYVCKTRYCIIKPLPAWLLDCRSREDRPIGSVQQLDWKAAARGRGHLPRLLQPLHV